MPITFVNAGAKGEAASGNVTAGAPASPVSGDIWIAACHTSDQNTHSFTDWTEIFQANGGGTTSRLSVWWFRYAGTTPNLTLTHTGGASPIIGIAAFRDCATSGSPVHLISAGGSGTDTTIEYGAITTTVDGCMLLAIDGLAGIETRQSSLMGSYAVAFEDPAGAVQRCFRTALGDPDGSVALWYLLQTTQGTTGSETSGMGGARPWTSVRIALAPPSGAPVYTETVSLASSAGTTPSNVASLAATVSLPAGSTVGPGSLGSFGQTLALPTQQAMTPAGQALLSGLVVFSSATTVSPTAGMSVTDTVALNSAIAATPSNLATLHSLLTLATNGSLTALSQGDLAALLQLSSTGTLSPAATRLLGVLLSLATAMSLSPTGTIVGGAQVYTEIISLATSGQLTPSLLALLQGTIGLLVDTSTAQSGGLILNALASLQSHAALTPAATRLLDALLSLATAISLSPTATITGQAEVYDEIISLAAAGQLTPATQAILQGTLSLLSGAATAHTSPLGPFPPLGGGGDMNLQFTSDLTSDVLFRAGEPTDGSSQYQTTVLSYLNRAYMGVCSGGSELMPEVRENWWWLRKYPPGLLFLIPPIASGGSSVLFGVFPATVTATINSTTLTFSSNVGTSLTGWHIRIGASSDLYRIAAHTSGTNTATLDTTWNNVTTTTSYLVGKLEYALAADVMRILSPMRSAGTNGNTDPTKIHEMDIEKLETDYPLAQVSSGMPEAFARVGLTQVRFNRFNSAIPDHYARVEYDYLQRPAMLTSPGITEEPLVPWEWRRVLADWALLWLFMDRNDSRADAVGLSAKQTLQAMARDNQDRLQNRSPVPYSNGATAPVAR
jgi:hypothetical protein